MKHEARDENRELTTRNRYSNCSVENYLTEQVDIVLSLQTRKSEVFGVNFEQDNGFLD
jgi:hypothetical protein